MLEREDQLRIEQNVRRTAMSSALRKIYALVQRAEGEQRIERAATIVAVVLLVSISALALFWFLLSSRPRAPLVIGGPSAPVVTRFTPYVAAWAQRVEAQARTSCTDFLSTANPRATVVLTSTIKSDGTLASVTILRSSQIEGLDKAAINHVVTAAPFVAFPPALKVDTDILEITREFQYHFAPCTGS
ncbi:MAG: TonB family protein [Sulfuritalea sp.]|nr:TonB family protein [Sulfuritalea sp.]